MSRSLNRALLIGNLGGDPESRALDNGNKVARFQLATNRSWTDNNGESQQRTEWHRIVAWNKLSEIVSKYLKKGDRVYIEGEIRYRTYEDAGVTKYTTDIIAQQLIMLGSANDESTDPNTRPATPSTPPSSPRNPPKATRRAVDESVYDDFEPPPPSDDEPF